MERYIKPEIIIVDLNADKILENVLVHGSNSVDQNPDNNNEDSGVFGAKQGFIDDEDDGSYKSYNVWED